MSAESIFRVIGGSRQGAGFVVRCPVSTHGQGRGDRSPSLSIRDSDGRLLVKCHAGCNSRDVLDVLRRRGLLDDLETSRRRDVVTSRCREVVATSRQSDDRWRELWNEGVGPFGTVVERYFASRNLELPANATQVIRFHLRCPFGTERLPCMMALFRDIKTDEPVAIHRTALALDGRKLGRKMLGPVAGAAIKLDADPEVSMGIVIGEGIESCLAARQLGFRPVWALGSAGAIGAFPVLPGIEGLTILAEHDEANAKAVQAAGKRWTAAGREVIVVTPLAGSDVNDALRAAT